METIQISQMIKQLKGIKRKYGDLMIAMSHDTEGNGYGTIHISDSFSVEEGKYGPRYLILWPYDERLELDELP